jgi:acetylornithine deacetylase/succinyl-diaminopimelate desuccinylase-like protein
MNFKTYISLFLLITIQSISAQRTYEIQAREVGVESLTLFKDFLALSNDAAKPDEITKNITWVKDRLVDLDFEIKMLKTSSLPLLIANKKIKKNLPTVAFYMHLDGQAVDLSKWDQQNPYQATIKTEEGGGFRTLGWEALDGELIDDLRIFARSSADDKGPFVMFITALNHLKKINKNPSFNIKLILDFEEEQSSPGLPQAVKKYKDDLLADLLLILDGPMHTSGLPTLVFGNRGISSLTLTTYGPLTAQHSGHYGNYIPNPALMLTKILASMKDDDGRVVIPDFYKGISISEDVKEVLEAVPTEERAIKERTQTKINDKVGNTYQESIQYPSLNIRGMQSGWVGKEARTIIPSIATAEIDIRLVLESKPEELIEGVENHIKGLGYTVIDHEPSKEERMKYDKIVRMNSKIAYPAFRTDTGSKQGKWLTNILSKYYNKNPVIIRTSGGSVPISPFVSQLGVPAIGVPTVNLDNNQHSPNENLRIGNYLMGIETILAILTSSY